MQQDFHYYATYCAAILAGYTHEESRTIGYSANLVDFCTRAFLETIRGPLAAATTQQQGEMIDTPTDPVSLQNITRIWASFHFLPGNLYAKKKGTGMRYLQKYRLICNPNGKLAAETVKLARGRSLQAAGVAMHVLADTWAHRYFAGTPSLVINNTTEYFYELMPEESGSGTGSEDGFTERKIVLSHNPALHDDPVSGQYVGTVYQAYENSIMNLGHGRAGHLPDYSWARYKYLPAWADYREVLKDNPSDYMHAFRQMVYALRYIRGEYDEFETEVYDRERVDPYEEEIGRILEKRQLDASPDWKSLGERLSGCPIRDFGIAEYQREYMEASKDAKDDTFLGQFILAALAQKSMVTGRIFQSGNLLAGFSVDFKKNGFQGIRDFRRLIEARKNNP